MAPNGRSIYAINHFDHAVFALNTNSESIRPIPLPGLPVSNTLSPNGLRLYAILEIDGSRHASSTPIRQPDVSPPVARLALVRHSSEPVFTIAGGRAYVLNSEANSVSVIDTASSVVTDVAVGRQPCDVAVSPDGRSAYVVNVLDDSLSIVGAADTVVATIAVGASPCRSRSAPTAAGHSSSTTAAIRSR